jgi:hypothetical protein
MDAKVPLKPGDEVPFSFDYGALLSAMTSPYVYKDTFIPQRKKESPFLQNPQEIDRDGFLGSMV